MFTRLLRRPPAPDPELLAERQRQESERLRGELLRAGRELCLFAHRYALEHDLYGAPFVVTQTLNEENRVYEYFYDHTVVARRARVCEVELTWHVARSTEGGRLAAGEVPAEDWPEVPRGLRPFTYLHATVANVTASVSVSQPLIVEHALGVGGEELARAVADCDGLLALRDRCQADERAERERAARQARLDAEDAAFAVQLSDAEQVAVDDANALALAQLRGAA